MLTLRPQRGLFGSSSGSLGEKLPGDSGCHTEHSRSVSVKAHRKDGDSLLKAEAVIADDDFGRVEIAINQGNFAEKYQVEQGDEIILEQAPTGKV